jgi:hypothetical protein
MFYDLGYSFTKSAFSTATYRFGKTVAAGNVAINSPSINAPVPSVPVTSPYQRLFAYARDYKLPYTLEYNVTIEHSIGNSGAASAACRYWPSIWAGRQPAKSDRESRFRSHADRLRHQRGEVTITPCKSSTNIHGHGLGKSFKMPYSEQHGLQFRWEAFNVTNSQPFGGIDGTGLTVNQDPNISIPPAQWSQFTRSATPSGETRPGRIMRFALRYSF